MTIRETLALAILYTLYQWADFIANLIAIW
jgi:hypothetical protein